MSTDTTRQPITISAISASRLSAGLHVKGDISGKEDFHIDGTVEGRINLEPNKLTVGTNAKLIGDVVAREVIVHGSVKGNLRVRDRIEIKRDCNIR
jgi:cytoskeletal protein CcmA (bactofilin family)